jgi:hypothetical protein
MQESKVMGFKTELLKAQVLATQQGSCGKFQLRLFCAKLQSVLNVGMLVHQIIVLSLVSMGYLAWYHGDLNLTQCNNNKR